MCQMKLANDESLLGKLEDALIVAADHSQRFQAVKSFFEGLLGAESMERLSPPANAGVIRFNNVGSATNLAVGVARVLGQHSILAGLFETLAARIVVHCERGQVAYEVEKGAIIHFYQHEASVSPLGEAVRHTVGIISRMMWQRLQTRDWEEYEQWFKDEGAIIGDVTSAQDEVAYLAAMYYEAEEYDLLAVLHGEKFRRRWTWVKAVWNRYAAGSP